MEADEEEPQGKKVEVEDAVPYRLVFVGIHCRWLCMCNIFEFNLKVVMFGLIMEALQKKWRQNLFQMV